MADVIVLGNIASDETLAVATLPAAGASVGGRLLGSDIGGKGLNQALVIGRALAAMGCAGQTRLVAALGQDARGAAARAALAAEPLVLDLLHRDLPSDWSVILRDADGENLIITTQDCARSITPDEAAARMPGAKVLVVQGNLEAKTALAALRVAGALGALRVLNPSPVEGCTQEMLRLADLLIVNEGEAAHFGGAAALSRQACVVRTLGARGVELWQEGACVFHQAITPVTALDPTGAGDCFLGALVARLHAFGRARPEPRDLAFAAWAAGLCVTRLGTQNAFPSQAEFAAAMKT